MLMWSGKGDSSALIKRHDEVDAQSSSSEADRASRLCIALTA